MKRIFALFVLVSIATLAFCQNYTTITDNCNSISFANNSLKKITIPKSDIKMQLTSQRPQSFVVSFSNETRKITWDSTQASKLGYTLTQLSAHMDSIAYSDCSSNTRNISISVNDSTPMYKVTDSLTLNGLTYKSITFCVTTGTATVRIGSKTITPFIAGECWTWTSQSGLLIEQRRFIAIGGTVTVTAIK